MRITRVHDDGFYYQIWEEVEQRCHDYHIWLSVRGRVTKYCKVQFRVYGQLRLSESMEYLVKVAVSYLYLVRGGFSDCTATRKSASNCKLFIIPRWSGRSFTCFVSQREGFILFTIN